MKLETKYFGEVDYDVTNIITFEEGIPGLYDERRYLILTDSENQAETENNIFFCLQCIDNTEIALAMINVLYIYPDYKPQLDFSELESIGASDAQSYYIYNIAVLPEDIKNIRVNLKAPIIINKDTKKAKQFILDNEEYNVRHFIYDDLKKLQLL